jgi:hypothetical protein
VGEAAELLDLIGDPAVADDALNDMVNAILGRGDLDTCRDAAVVAAGHGRQVEAALLAATAGDLAPTNALLAAAGDEAALVLGVPLAEIRWRSGGDRAARTVRAQVPIAERLRGPQWFRARDDRRGSRAKRSEPRRPTTRSTSKRGGQNSTGKNDHDSAGV